MWKKCISRTARYPSHFIPSRLGMKCDVARNSKGKGGGAKKVRTFWVKRPYLF